MSGNLGEIVAQLKDAIGRIDKAAIAAMRAGKDATEAHQAFKTAGQGSEHPKIRQAITDTAEAAAKADKVARLYAEAGNAFNDYLNHIAPGSAPARKAIPGSSPAGEAIVSESEQRGSRFDKAFGKQVRKADDTEDALKQIEDAGRNAYKHIKQQPPDPGSTTAGSVPPQPTPQERPQVDNPITAIVMATGAMVVAGKAALNQIKKRSERKSDDDD